MTDAVMTYLHEQAYRLRDLDSHSVDATMLELAAERLREHRAIMRQVATWWTSTGTHAFDGTPECMLALRRALSK